MRTVGDLIQQLQKFSKDDFCFAYEGEDIGIVIKNLEQKTVVHGFHRMVDKGFIRCKEDRDLDVKPAEIYTIE